MQKRDKSRSDREPGSHPQLLNTELGAYNFALCTVQKKSPNTRRCVYTGPAECIWIILSQYLVQFSLYLG